MEKAVSKGMFVEKGDALRGGESWEMRRGEKERGK